MSNNIKKNDYQHKYGPWVVICGASDGTGASFAHQLAALGLNLVLVARRLGPLQELAAELEQEHGIKTRAASVDLYGANAAQQVLDLAEDLDVGLLVSNAGADTNNGVSFLDAPLDAWRQLITRNVLSVTELVYGFAGPMRERGRGGIILMSSGTALGGQTGVAVYSGTKAYDLNLAESLWCELAPFNIDVLSGVCPGMNTPSLQKVLAVHDLTVPGLFEPDDVARTLIEKLPQGPIHIFPFGPEAEKTAEIEQQRRDRIETMSEAAKMFFGDSV